MDDPGVLHRIEDDLSETWVEEFAADGVQALEAYLAKHLAFLSFLDESRRLGGAAEAYASASPRAFSSEPFGIAPTADACGSPFSNRTMKGIDATP